MAIYKVWVGLALGSMVLSACASSRTKGKEPEDAGATAPEGPACFAYELSAQLDTRAVQDVDIVFAIDNSESMREEQEALAAEFPRMLSVLSSGDRDGDAVADFPAARSVHLAVVSTDLGLPGVEGIDGCDGTGDDGRFNGSASAEVVGCSTAMFEPPFLTFSRDDGDDIAATATDLACLARLGLDGCTIEQPLESLLKAVWPASRTEVTFLTEMGTQTGGHAGPGAPNGDFFRDDPAGAPSVIALVVVTDEEDCSVRDTGFLVPGAAESGIDTRCYLEGQRAPDSSLFAVERYIQTFKELRAGREEQVIFAGIVGVPPHLTTPDTVNQFDFAEPAQANAFFDMLLSAPEMQEVIDARDTMDPADDRLVPSCARGGEDQLAFPPRRIVQVARGFGANGIIQSICRDELRPAIDPIIDAIGSKLGAPCLPRAIPRNAEGLVDCHVTWEMGESSGEVAQLAVTGDEVIGEGWYYDDFSDVTQRSCLGADRQRIAFTDDGQPPGGATTRLHCFRAEHYVETDRTDLDADATGTCSAGPASASPELVGEPCLTLFVPEDGFEDSTAYIEGNHPYCDGAACIVYHLAGDPREDCGARGDAVRCAAAEEIEARVYCSCRCDAPEGFAECECPDGFSCVEVLDHAPPEIAGSYCVRDGSVAQ